MFSAHQSLIKCPNDLDGNLPISEVISSLPVGKSTKGRVMIGTKKMYVIKLVRCDCCYADSSVAIKIRGHHVLRDG